MLSFPMKGKTKEQIEIERNAMIDYLFDTYHDDCIVVDSIITNPESKSELQCFAESIFHLGESDVICMGRGWENSRGCRLEHEIAVAYGMPIIYLEDKVGKYSYKIADDGLEESIDILGADEVIYFPNDIINEENVIKVVKLLNKQHLQIMRLNKENLDLKKHINESDNVE